MEIVLDKRAVRQIRLSALDAIEEGDIETLREDILEAFTEEQVEEIERRLDSGDFFEFLTDMLDEWSGDDADELFELIDTQLGDVGVDVKFEKKAPVDEEDEEGGGGDAEEFEEEDEDLDEDDEEDDDEDEEEDEEEEAPGRRRGSARAGRARVASARRPRLYGWHSEGRAALRWARDRSGTRRRRRGRSASRGSRGPGSRGARSPRCRRRPRERGAPLPRGRRRAARTS